MYNQLAQYYDLIHEPLTADIPFVLQLAAEAGGPVLELGCGSGRLLFPLARTGYLVTGLDNSTEMLARARQRLAAEPPAVQSRVRLIEGDMVRGELPGEDGRYALVFAGYNTFMHLTSPQMRAALRWARRLFRPDGRLFLDLTNPFILAEAEDAPLPRLENVLRDPQTGDVVRQLSAQRLNAAGQVLHVTWIFDAILSGDGRAERSVVEMDYFYYYPHEWELILLEAGLRLESLMGDYDGAPFSEESERLLLIGSPAT
jgi:SAM-dependent methyltransferase